MLFKNIFVALLVVSVFETGRKEETKHNDARKKSASRYDFLKKDFFRSPSFRALNKQKNVNTDSTSADKSDGTVVSKPTQARIIRDFIFRNFERFKTKDPKVNETSRPPEENNSDENGEDELYAQPYFRNDFPHKTAKTLRARSNSSIYFDSEEELGRSSNDDTYYDATNSLAPVNDSQKTEVDEPDMSATNKENDKGFFDDNTPPIPVIRDRKKVSLNSFIFVGLALTSVSALVLFCFFVLVRYKLYTSK